MPIHRAEERILPRAPEHRNSLSSIYAEFCVPDPREKHLGLEKKDLQASLTNSSLKEDVTSQ